MLRRGGTIPAAAKAIGTYARAIRRYAERDSDFAVAMVEAEAEGERVRVCSGATGMTAGDAASMKVDPPTPNTGGPRGPSVVAAEVLGFDVGLVGAADDSMPSVLGLPPINLGNFMALMWKRAHGFGNDGGPCAPAIELAGIAVCKDVLAAPTIAAQRRLDDVAKRIAHAESVGDVSGGIGVELGGEGMTILEIPRNGSEAPGHEPRPATEVDT